MNRKLVSLLMIPALLSAVNLHPKRAEAIIAVAGNATAIPALIVIGAGVLVETASGVLGQALTPRDPFGKEVTNVPEIVGISAGALIALIGVVLLDASHPDQATYGVISSENAAKLGITGPEMASFNDELPEINAIAQSIGEDLSTEKTATVQLAGQRWSAYTANGALAPESLAALAKISRRAKAQN